MCQMKKKEWVFLRGENQKFLGNDIVIYKELSFKNKVGWLFSVNQKNNISPSQVYLPCVQTDGSKERSPVEPSTSNIP